MKEVILSRKAIRKALITSYVQVPASGEVKMDVNVVSASAASDARVSYFASVEELHLFGIVVAENQIVLLLHC